MYCYARLEDRQGPCRPKPAVNVPEPVETQAVVEGEPGTQPKALSCRGTDSTGHMNRFDILGESPYSK